MTTFMDTREALAEAVSTVPGLTGFLFRPPVLVAGQAWPLFVSADRAAGDAFGGAWRVVVCLGGDELAASAKTDTVLPDLVQAVDPVAYVQQVIPGVLSTQAGEMHILELSCLSE